MEDEGESAVGSVGIGHRPARLMKRKGEILQLTQRPLDWCLRGQISQGDPSPESELKELKHDLVQVF